MVKLTALQNENREKCIAFSKKEINSTVKEREDKSLFDKKLWKSMSEINIHGLFISKDYGGLDYSLSDGMSMLESIGFSIIDNGLIFAATAQLTSCSITLNKYGSDKLKSSYLPSIVNGDTILAHAITEDSSGSNAFHMESTYSYNESSNLFDLKGAKTYCTNLPICDYAIGYFNKTNTETSSPNSSAFIIPRSKISNIETIDKMGLNTCKMGKAEFNLSLDKPSLIGTEGNGILMFQEAIMLERIGMSALHIGTVERILFDAIKWTKTRKVSGASLATKQAITHPLVSLYNEYISLRTLLYNITSLNLSFTKRYLSASILKDKVSELYVNAATQILQIYGGLGYTKTIEIERVVRDALASKIYSGTSEIQKEIIWKYIS